MTREELNSTVQEARELRRMAAELQAELEALTDSIKHYMDAQNVDTISGADWQITYKPVTASRIDTAAFKKARPKLAAQYTRESTSKRLVWA